MQLGMIGLGRMGANMVRRLMKNGHQCVVFDRSAEAVAGAGQGGRRRRGLARRLRREAQAAARGLADGPRGGRRRDRRGPRCRSCRRATSSSTAATPTTSTTSAAQQRAAAQGHPLRRRRHQRRRLGAGARLLHDDRRRQRKPSSASIPIFKTLAPGRGNEIPRTPGREKVGRHRRRGLPALRAVRRGALRQDGPQRHRVRHHGRLRRGAEHPQARQRRQDEHARSTPRRRRCATPSTTSTTSTSPTSPRSGGAAA